MTLSFLQLWLSVHVLLYSTTTIRTEADGMSIPRNATALPVINLQLICATDIRTSRREVPTQEDSQSQYESQSQSQYESPPQEDYEYRVPQSYAPWNAKQVFQDYYASLNMPTLTSLNKLTLTYMERLDGMDSFLDHHPDVSTMCNLSSPMTMLTLLMEGYYYDYPTNDDDDDEVPRSSSTLQSLVNASSVKTYMSQHICPDILLWQALVIHNTNSNSATNNNMVHNAYPHNPFEMCELEEMFLSGKINNNTNLGVPLIFGLLVGLFMCGMLTHALTSLTTPSSRRHHSYRLPPLTSSSSSERHGIDMELPIRHSNSNLNAATATTRSNPAEEQTSIYEEAIRPID
jgi:hypothetical protein